MKILGTPFKTPQVSFYFGKIAVGTPYFLPRVWRRLTDEEVEEEIAKEITRISEAYRKAGKGFKKFTVEEVDNLRTRFSRTRRARPRKFGFDIVGMGWKTKFDYYRHEWNPGISFVAFNRQINLTFGLKGDYSHNMCYWEAFLYYDQETDKTKTKEQRLLDTMEQYSATWISRKDGVETKTNYYNHILKDKYLKHVKQEE